MRNTDCERMRRHVSQEHSAIGLVKGSRLTYMVMSRGGFYVNEHVTVGEQSNLVHCLQLYTVCVKNTPLVALGTCETAGFEFCVLGY